MFFLNSKKEGEYLIMLVPRSEEAKSWCRNGYIDSRATIMDVPDEAASVEPGYIFMTEGFSANEYQHVLSKLKKKKFSDADFGDIGGYLRVLNIGHRKFADLYVFRKMTDKNECALRSLSDMVFLDICCSVEAW